MGKIKVLHIITRIDPGGSTYNTLETVAQLDKERYESTLISGKSSLLEDGVKRFLREKKINNIFLNDLRRNGDFYHDLKALFKLYRFCRKNKFDIVHTHSSKAGILGRWAAWFAGVKYIVHTPHGHIFHGYFNSFLTTVFIFYERITGVITDKIITLTTKGKEDHIQHKIAKPNKFVPIYSGVDLGRFAPQEDNVQRIRKEFNIADDDYVIGCVARLDPIKGNEYIIQAFGKIAYLNSNVKLILVGDGTEREELEAQVEGLEINDKVIFAGFQENVSAYIQMMDVFVLASLNEGMGRVILEAMASSKPVIASRTGGIPELVIDGETGILFKPQNTDELKNAMLSLICDKQKAIEMGKNGFRRVDEKFSIGKMVDDIDKLYQQLMEEKK